MSLNNKGAFAKIVKDFDKKLVHDLKKRLGQDDRVVKIGVPASAEPEENGTPMALVAAVHEFGSEKMGIPERSYLRSGINENKQDFIRLNRINFIQIIKQKQTIEGALKMLGLMGAAAVQKKIRKGPFKELKESTIARKGSSTPLIDQGQLVQSITYELGVKGD